MPLCQTLLWEPLAFLTIYDTHSPMSSLLYNTCALYIYGFCQIFSWLIIKRKIKFLTIRIDALNLLEIRFLGAFPVGSKVEFILQVIKNKVQFILVGSLYCHILWFIRLLGLKGIIKRKKGRTPIYMQHTSPFYYYLLWYYSF